MIGLASYLERLELALDRQVIKVLTGVGDVVNPPYCRCLKNGYSLREYSKTRSYT